MKKHQSRQEISPSKLLSQYSAWKNTLNIKLFCRINTLREKLMITKELPELDGLIPHWCCHSMILIGEI
jgi:hypothetical protein